MERNLNTEPSQKKLRIRTLITDHFKPSQIFSPPSLEVVDGDTVKFPMYGHTFYLRITGVNAPELYSANAHKSPQPFSQEAKDRLGQLLLDEASNWKIVLHERLIDGTGIRLLGYLFVEKDGEFVNVSHILLAEGLAVPYMMEQRLTLEEQLEYQDLAYEAERLRLGVYSIRGYVTEFGRFNEDI
ncbi:thermonuclease family protein [Risungbinella massiliensis]|uniref:thermonuclease family protein n=1 Tax=Risungbinella massiliensis TaxID=1329796 RepID=UPI00069BD537|nr:thermonuclease family protein [Risungbinella massiliensis]